MSISLRKGEKVSLRKKDKGLSDIYVACGWDEVKQEGGFFGKLLKGSPKDIDIDVSVIVCRDKKYRNTRDLIYFGNLTHESNAIIHQGDNLTGKGDGDDEVINIRLTNLPEDVDKCIVVANIYKAKERNQNFKIVKNAYIRIVNCENNTEFAKYDMSNDLGDHTAMIFGELNKVDGEWLFTAVGEGTYDNGLQDMVRRYE